MNSSIFDMDIDSLVVPETKYETDIFKPSLKKEQKQNYAAILKFLPWHKDYTKSRINKWSIWLKNPSTDEGKSIDCPSTVGDKSVLRDIYFALKQSSRVDEQDLATEFSRKERNFALVQIVEDDQHPELVGQIKVFEYGKTLREKIDLQLKPVNIKVPPHNPFNVFDGKLFSLYIQQVGNFPNYDKSEFIDEKSSILIDGKKVANDKKNYEKVSKFLEEKSPDLTKYAFVPWTPEIKEYVYDCITATLLPGKILTQILKNTGGVKAAVNIPEKPKVNNVSEHHSKMNSSKVVDEEEIDDIIIDEDEDSEIAEILNNTRTTKSKGKSKPVIIEDDVDDEDMNFFDEDDEEV